MTPSENGAMREGRRPRAPEAKSQMSEAFTAMTWLAVVLTKGLPMMRSEDVMVSSCRQGAVRRSQQVWKVTSSGQLLKHNEIRSGG